SRLNVVSIRMQQTSSGEPGLIGRNNSDGRGENWADVPLQRGLRGHDEIACAPVKVEHTVVLVGERRDPVISQAEIQRYIGMDLEIVLDIPGNHVIPAVGSLGRCAAAGALRNAKKEVGISRPRKGSSEVEASEERIGNRQARRLILFEVHSNFYGMASRDDRDVVGEIVTHVLGTRASE